MNSSKEQLEIRSSDTGVWIRIKVAAGARRNQIQGVHGGMLKLSVTTAPEKGRANQAIVALLAQRLGITQNRIEMRAGKNRGQKSIFIQGVSASQLIDRLGL